MTTEQTMSSGDRRDDEMRQGEMRPQVRRTLWISMMGPAVALTILLAAFVF